MMLHGSRFHMDWDDELSRFMSVDPMERRLRPLLRWLKRKQRFFAAGPGPRNRGCFEMVEWRELSSSTTKIAWKRIVKHCLWQTLFFGKTTSDWT